MWGRLIVPGVDVLVDQPPFQNVDFLLQNVATLDRERVGSFRIGQFAASLSTFSVFVDFQGFFGIGDATFSRTAYGMMTLSFVTLSIMAIGIMALNAMTLRVMTLSIIAFSILTQGIMIIPLNTKHIDS